MLCHPGRTHSHRGHDNQSVLLWIGRQKLRIAATTTEALHKVTMVDWTAPETSDVTVSHLLVVVGECLMVEPLKEYLLRPNIENGLAESATMTTALCEHHYEIHGRHQFDHYPPGMRATPETQEINVSVLTLVCTLDLQRWRPVGCRLPPH